MHKFTVMAFIGVAGIGLTACGGTTSAPAAGPTKVQIAAEGPFTGDEASIGRGAFQAIELAVEDFNNAGGVKGTKVQLLEWDDAHSPQTAATLQAQGISDPTVLGVIGPMNSGVVLGTIQGLQGASPPLPLISESASNPKVTDGGYSVAHRVNARDDGQGPADAKFMIDQGAKKVEVMDAKSDYSTALADITAKYLADKAPSIMVQRDSAQHGQTDFATIVQRIKSFGADWVFFADEGPEAAPLVQQLKGAGLTIPDKINFLGTDGEDDSSIITKSQGAFLGAYASNITPDPGSVPAAADMIARYKAKFGADSISKAGPFYGSAYAATQVLLQAIAASPVVNGKISRADVLTQLGSGSFNTVLGTVKFDSKGDWAGVAIGLFQAKGTDMVSVKSITG